MEAGWIKLTSGGFHTVTRLFRLGFWANILWFLQKMKDFLPSPFGRVGVSKLIKGHRPPTGAPCNLTCTYLTGLLSRWVLFVCWISLESYINIKKIKKNIWNSQTAKGQMAGSHIKVCFSTIILYSLAAITFWPRILNVKCVIVAGPRLRQHHAHQQKPTVERHWSCTVRQTQRGAAPAAPGSGLPGKERVDPNTNPAHPTMNWPPARELWSIHSGLPPTRVTRLVLLYSQTHSASVSTQFTPPPPPHLQEVCKNVEPHCPQQDINHVTEVSSSCYENIAHLEKKDATTR